MRKHSYIIIVIGLTLALWTSGFPAYAQSGSSPLYSLNLQQNGNSGSSGSYQTCSQISSYGNLGASASYSLTPNVNCPSTTVNLCGNAVIDAGEQCDGANLAGNTCATLGFNSGTLSCGGTCQFTGCFNAGGGGGGGGSSTVCGNTIINIGEQCDDGNLTSGDGCSASCQIEPGIPPTPPLLSPPITFTPSITSPEISLPEYVPAQVVQPPRRLTVTFRPSAPEIGPGRTFITNDTTPLLFWAFEETEKPTDTLVTFEREKRLYGSTLYDAPRDITSFEPQEELPNNWYDVNIIDRKNELKREKLKLEVNTKRDISSPIITKFNDQTFDENDQDFSSKMLTISDGYPVISGKTPEKATIAVLDVRNNIVSILQTDAKNEFRFTPARVLGYGKHEFRIVALYEHPNEKLLSKEVRIPFEIIKPAVCALCVIIGYALPVWVCVLLIILSIIAVVLTVYLIVKRCRGKKEARQKSPKPIARRVWSIFLAALLLFTTLIPNKTLALDTTPLFSVYTGILKDNLGAPITTARQFRFSIWTSDDFSGAADLTGGGPINTASLTYGGWKEEQIITPDTNGYFSVNLGATTLDPWPNFNSGTHKFLQVDVKLPADADTLYQRIDPNGPDDTDDRHDIGSEPYARNADYIDNKEIGTAAGNIAILGPGGVWDITLMPAGTNADIWQIDQNDNAPGGIVQLAFGSALSNHILSWDPDGVALGDGWFNFNDDVNIAGDLTVTGSITGDIAFSNLVPRTKTEELIPHYPGATIQTVGAGGHKGKVETFFIDTDAGGPDNFNYYKWSTQQATTQDIDLVVKFRIPDDFTSWQAIPIVFRYKTDTALAADNQIDVTIHDTTGATIGTLTGNSGLVSATFTTTNITYGGGGVFTPGDEITIYIKMSAKSTGAAYVSDLKFQYNGR